MGNIRKCKDCGKEIFIPKYATYTPLCIKCNLARYKKKLETEGSFNTLKNLRETNTNPLK